LQDWAVGTALPAIWNAVGEWALALTDWFVTQAIPWGLEKAGQFIDAILAWIKDTALPYLIEKAPEWAAALTDWIKNEAIPAALEKLGELLDKFKQWVTDTLPVMKEKGTALAGDLISGLASGLETFFTQQVVPFFTGLPARVKGLVADAASWLVEAGGQVIAGLVSGITGAFNLVTEAFFGLPGKVTSAVGDLSGVLKNAGRQIIAGLVSGIAEKAGDAASAAKNAVQGAISAATSVLRIGSPSKVFIEIGQSGQRHPGRQNVHCVRVLVRVDAGGDGLAGATVARPGRR
jgi:hypothetical protein